MSEYKHVSVSKNSSDHPVHNSHFRQQRRVCTNYRATVCHFHSPSERVWPLRGRQWPIPVLPMYPPDAFYPPFVGLPVVPIPVLVPHPVPYFDSSQVSFRNESWEYNCNVYSCNDLESPQSTESLKHAVVRRPIKIEKPPEMLKRANVDSDCSTQDTKPTATDKLNAECVKSHFLENLCNAGSPENHNQAFHLQNQNLPESKEKFKMPSNEKNQEEPVCQVPEKDQHIPKTPTNQTDEGRLYSEYRLNPAQARIKRSSHLVTNISKKQRECSTSASSTSCLSDVGSTISPEKDLNVSIESRHSKTTSPNTSAYFSSLDSSSSFSTPEVIIRRNPKRPYADLSDNEHSSPNSSFNSRSSYHTPDRSFDESPTSKRPRWNEYSTPTRRDSGSFSNSSSRSFSAGRYCHQQYDGGPVIQPQFIGYQLLGDSQFCRFGQQLLGLQRVPCPNSPGRIGICVSGQTINDLHERIKEKFYPLSDKVILMIGTNDFLRNHSSDVTEMCNKLSALVKTLQETVTNIVLLTLPPIPKLERQFKTQHFAMLHKYNSFIRSLACGDKLRIGDISPMYMTDFPYQKCRMNLFELYFSNSQRPDMIHLNRHGLEVIKKYILEHFLNRENTRYL